MISSILSIKGYEVESDGFRKILEESNAKIRSMAIAHDKLFKSEDLSKIDLIGYVNELVAEVRSLNQNHKLTNVDVRVEGEKILIDVDFALCIGLIINELITNALKYGFEHKNRGSILVKAYFNEMSNIEIQVINDGAAITMDFANLLKKSKGMGMMIVKTFVDQIKGKIEVINENGFTGFKIQADLN